MASTILVYGSYGYTGELIVELAKAEGRDIILAGRTPERVQEQSKATGYPGRTFALDEPEDVDRGLQGVGAVLHCAGPFSRTGVPMAEGCMRAGAHYLDITGEIDVFEAMHERDAAAKRANVLLMPGTGFDVVPSDCLAAHLKNRLPTATELTLAFKGDGKPSRGTATTMIENIGNGGMIRKEGALTPVPSAWKSQVVDFGESKDECITIPWGDVSTAYYSTGIPNIMVYMAATAELKRMAKFSRYFGWLLNAGPIQSFLKQQIQAGPAGPSAQERETGVSLLWGRVTDGNGASAEARLRAPEGYRLTARTAYTIAKRAADGEVPTGFNTPSMAFGADFITEFEGVVRTDV